METKIVNTQKAITPKVGKPELWFMCSAPRLMVFKVGVKFHENVSRSLTVKGGHGNYKHTKGNNSNRRKTRKTVHVFYTSSYGA